MQTSLIITLVILVIFLIVLERIHSINVLIRLCLSAAVMYGYIKMMVEGKSMILFSILATSVIAVIHIFIKNGIHRKSFSEFISVFVTMSITSITFFFLCKKWNMNLFQSEIKSLNGVRKTENAILGLFLIGSLGIYMDIISRMIFHLDEQKDKTIDTPWKEQFKQGIEIGRGYIDEKINTILLIVFSAAIFPICLSINKGVTFAKIWEQPEIFAYSLMFLVASIGLLLSVFITSCTYACFNRKKTVYKTISENKVDGKRSLKL